MTRRRAALHPRADRGPALDPDIPVPGFYRIRLIRGGPYCALRIWLGAAIDPATGLEVEERGYRWQCAVNGQRVPFEDHWPGCARDPISKQEYERILAESRTMDGRSAFFDPRRRIDLMTAPPAF